MSILSDAMTSPQRTAASQASADFETCFEALWPRIYAHLLGMLGDPAEAQDLALETFYRLSVKPVVEVGQMTGWLYRVATNLGLNALRAQKRRQRFEQTAGEQDLLLHAPGDAAQEAERRLERQLVRQVLAQMPPRQAQLLLLRQAGMSYLELAQALGLNPASVGKLLSRAQVEFARRYRTLEGDL